MASTNSSTPSNPTVGDTSVATAEDATAKPVIKRFESLVTVRNKAVKGKGAWYWAHLEPILVHHVDTGLPKAVKLRCSLCDAVFSASNPSRTASEHLKRGTCPNFNTSVVVNHPKPISSISPSAATSSSSFHANNRKRPTPPAAPPPLPLPLPPPPQQSSAMIDPSRFSPLTLSGGKDDLGALAMLEDSVKRLKSPKASPVAALSRAQLESAMELLSDWVYESCGSVSFSSLEHPKFKAFLHQVGIPPISRRSFAGVRLDARFEEARAESEARIRGAMFFQLASDGWKKPTTTFSAGDDDRRHHGLVNLTVNLPNGTSLYRRAVFLPPGGSVPSEYAEEVLFETVAGICGNAAHRCVGIVSDKFKGKALRKLESRHQWMVNLSCQARALSSLIKDFSRDLPLFTLAAADCQTLAAAINSDPHIRSAFHKHQLQQYGLAAPIRLQPSSATLDDVITYARAVQLAADASADDPAVAAVVGDRKFWSRLEAVQSLVKTIRQTSKEVETDRPLIGQCLPLWDEVRAKVREWSSSFDLGADVAAAAERILERRFTRNYHPAWAAAYILDPQYLIRDSSGKYLPPFKCLTAEQEKDVDRLITRLVGPDGAHVAVMELMKWRSEGLDPVYARAVQMKERDPATGRMRAANPQSGRLVWETYLTGFGSLARVAARLIFLRATAGSGWCGSGADLARWVRRGGARAEERVGKMVFVAANAKLERRGGGGGGDDDVDDGDAEILALADEEEQEEEEALDTNISNIVTMARPP